MVPLRFAEVPRSRGNVVHAVIVAGTQGTRLQRVRGPGLVISTARTKVAVDEWSALESKQRGATLACAC